MRWNAAVCIQAEHVCVPVNSWTHVLVFPPVEFVCCSSRLWMICLTL